MNTGNDSGENKRIKDNFAPHDSVPDRTPRAVTEGIKDIVHNKTVCDLCGCSYGDNLIFMLKYAKSVIGIDVDKERINYAKGLGLNVKNCSWQEAVKSRKSLPQADVYYCIIHPNAQDRLVKAFFRVAPPKATLILAGNGSFHQGREKAGVKRLSKRGELRIIPFETYDGKIRKSYRTKNHKGEYYLAIITTESYEQTK